MYTPKQQFCRMKELSFKNYPTKVLVTIISLIIALSFAFQAIWKALKAGESMTLAEQVICIAGSSGLVLGILGYINSHIMWKWYLKLLRLCDIRGIYEGVLTSSYHVNDNPALPYEQLYAKFEIYQTLNGFRIEGRFFTDRGYTQLSSSSTSNDGEIRKEENGKFRVYYFFSNKGNQFHENQKRYGLNNHDGVCVFMFDPGARNMEGYYYTHERSSYGTISLKPV